MRDISAPNFNALKARELVARDFLWIVARTWDTKEPIADGQWSDVGYIDAEVINPITGGPETRRFFGSDTLTRISDITHVATLRAQSITITMSNVSDRVRELVHAYDCRQARVEIFRGMFNPRTRELVAPAFPRFIGFSDKPKITRPKANDTSGGSVVFNCMSHTLEMTRSNPDVRSHESQQRRLDGDAFFKDVSTVGDWEHFVGKLSGKVPTSSGASPEKKA